MRNKSWNILLLLSFMLCCASCQWRDAKAVIAMADSIDQTQHVIWDDTAALGQTIRQLDNPFGRLFMRSTLGKAYYYMGRNLEDTYQQVAEAAKCYIEADRLQIADPIYRGRVNTCMGYICAQNNNDSLALIFYERASENFKESGNDWRYVQSLLSITEGYIYLNDFFAADSLLRIVQSYDSVFFERCQYIKGCYFYEKQEYDSALVYFKYCEKNRHMDANKCYLFMYIMRTYLKQHKLDLALPYAKFIVNNTNIPNLLKNAYYCLELEAETTNDTKLLGYYAHIREDVNRILMQNKSKYDIAVTLLGDYLLSPNPLRLVWSTIIGVTMLCILLMIGFIMYRKDSVNRLQTATSSLQDAAEKIEDLSTRLEAQENNNYYDPYIFKILKKYPTPPNRWNEYSQLRKDIEPYLHDWLIAVEKLTLTNREKVLCIFIFIYRHLSVAKIADYMNNTERAVRVLKTRVAQKLGITSAELIDYLLNLHVNK